MGKLLLFFVFSLNLQAFELEDFKNHTLFSQEKSRVNLHYMYQSLKSMRAAIKKEKEIPQLASIFSCYRESSCQDGLDLDQITREELLEYMISLGSFSGVGPSFVDLEAVSGETVLILHGQEPSAEQLHFNISGINKYKVKHVIVNLPVRWWSQFSVGFFDVLASYMRDNQVNLYVTGLCGGLCSSMLVPASRRVFVGNYGAVVYEISFSTMYKDFHKNFSSKTRAIEASLRKEYDRKNWRLFARILSKDKDFLTNISRQKFSRFKEYFDANRELIHLDSEKEWVKFIKEIEQEDVLLQLLGYVIQSRLDAYFLYYNRLYLLANKELAYFAEKNPQSKSGKHSFYDFIQFAQNMVRISDYDKLYPETPRVYYKVRENKKPSHIFPETSLLKDFGVRVVGTNNEDVVSKFAEVANAKKPTDSPDLKYLKINQEDIQACKFFEPEASYSQEELQACLVSEQPQDLFQ